MAASTRKSVIFIALTFFFSWLMAILFTAFGGKWNTSAALAIALGYMFVPMSMTIAAAILHGSLNATVGLAIIVIEGGNDLTVGATGLAGFIVLAIVNAGILVYDRALAEEPVTVKS